MSNESKVGKVLWRPPQGQETELDIFREKINKEYGLKLGMFTASLHALQGRAH